MNKRGVTTAIVIGNVFIDADRASFLRIARFIAAHEHEYPNLGQEINRIRRRRVHEPKCRNPLGDECSCAEGPRIRTICNGPERN
jgi:hypothetical protein